LAYLAPEVLAGERSTAAADVYALGVVAFVALTGHPPRPASSMAELVTSSSASAPPISAAALELGPAFDDTVGAAPALRPGDRPDALSFASGLAAALGRWMRDGGPGRAAASAFPAAAGTATPSNPPSLIAVGRPRVGDPAPVEDETTAIAVPLGATAALPIETI